MTEPRSRATVLPASADVGIVDASWRVALPQPPLNNNFSLQYDAGKKQWVEPSFEVYKTMEVVQRKWPVLVEIACDHPRIAAAAARRNDVELARVFLRIRQSGAIPAALATFRP